MALVQTTLATQLEAAMRKAQTDSSPASLTVMAKDMAAAIDLFVKSATVTTPIATTVTTTGSAVAQAGAGVGTGIGVVS